MPYQPENQTLGKIIWAVDPLTEDRGLHSRLAKLIEAVREPSTVIEPVYVLSPDQLEMAPGFFSSHTPDLKKAMEQRLKSWTAKFQLKEVLSPTLVVSNEASLRSSVAALLTYARETGAQAIAVASHSRRGLKRLALGSFAESLVLQSEIPVLLVTPRTKTTGKIERILFPTDASSQSKAAFQELLRTHAGTKEIILFNSSDLSTDCMVFEYGATPQYFRALSEEIARRREELERWSQIARRQGISCKIILIETPGDVVGRLVEATSRNKCDLIALASQDGRLAAALKGSISRRIIRNAKCPLWIAHIRHEDSVSQHKAQTNEFMKGAVTA